MTEQPTKTAADYLADYQAAAPAPAPVILDRFFPHEPRPAGGLSDSELWDVKDDESVEVLVDGQWQAAVVTEAPSTFNGAVGRLTLTASGIETTWAPAANLCVMRRAAATDDMLAELESIPPKVQQMISRRDELVRALMETSVKRSRIAEAADVKEPRLYQIRDGRR